MWECYWEGGGRKTPRSWARTPRPQKYPMGERSCYSNLAHRSTCLEENADKTHCFGTSSPREEPLTNVSNCFTSLRITLWSGLSLSHFPYQLWFLLNLLFAPSSQGWEQFRAFLEEFFKLSVVRGSTLGWQLKRINPTRLFSPFLHFISEVLPLLSALYVQSSFQKRVKQRDGQVTFESLALPCPRERWRRGGACSERRRCSAEQGRRGKISAGLFCPRWPLPGGGGKEEQQEVQPELSSCSPLSPEKMGKEKVTSPSSYRAWQGLRLK